MVEATKTARRFWKWVWRNWLSVVVMCIALFTIVVICIFFFIEWPNAKPAEERIFGTTSYIWFGLSTVGSLVVSLVVLATVKKKAFTDSSELLKRLIMIFDEARYCKGPMKISLLHFVPCPGLFDEMFRKTGMFSKWPKFSKLQRLVPEVEKRSNVTIRVAMLEQPERFRYLTAFFDHEKQEVSAKVLDANAFVRYSTMAELFIVQNFGPHCVSHIHKTWLERSMKGDEFIILGAAERTGFIGSISFEEGDFWFQAADYEGDTHLLHTLFDKLIEVYGIPPSS